MIVFRLSDHAKQLFNHLGSAMIQNLKFRDVWTLVTQKGIQGFSQIEQVNIYREGEQMDIYRERENR